MTATANHRAVGDSLALLQRRRTSVLVAGGAAATLLLFALSTEDGPVLCPVRRCTGGYCPACGMTRSGGRLLRGDLAGSWQHHPYLIFGVAQAVVAAAAWTVGSASVRQRMRSAAVPVLLLNAAALTVLWAVRLVTGAIPVPFVT